ncbi:hypothetical protein D1113_02870 [Mycoplasmopsis gallopavonis]|uniref:Uncharacterized protein n=2 Tax=Mycoplasmopsis gallopavonis TaxID=76629 RepID=A0A449B0J0_9BACT|nr:hypothetical protein [Mycoplasmopsis gallopavonis]RIV16314.1 hypothetical protein D1113_02870 [Mycoplasmopsis gallopavonis]VEU73237.1 Uncharacterised protein [Mycoplasmopsis gallopavonis]
MLDSALNTENKMSLIYITLIVFAFVIGFGGSFYATYFNKQTKRKSLILEIFAFAAFGLLATFIYLSAKMPISYKSAGIIVKSNIDHLNYGLFFIVALLLLICYFAIAKYVVDKRNQMNFRELLISIFAFFLFLSFLIFGIGANSRFNQNIISLGVVLFLVGFMILTKIIFKRISIKIKFILSICFILFGAILIVDALDLLMSANQNKLLSSIYLTLDLHSLLVLVVLAFIFVVIIVQIAKWAYLFYLVKKVEKYQAQNKIKEVH